jgi:hypothetical protein
MKLKSALALSVTLVLATLSHAAIIVYTAPLSGAAESPPNASPGTGLATITFDDTIKTMRVEAIVSGLTGNITNVHIHAATATAFTGTSGVATTTPTFTGFPSGSTSAVYDTTFDMTLGTSYNATYITANGGTTAGAFAALLSAAAAGKAYFNVHSTTFGGGEVRGFLTAIPEPSSAALLFGLASSALVTLRRRRR